jgi:hypothetical protein
VQHQGKLTSEWATTEARLVDLFQRESALEACWATTKERAERHHPAFARASQNVAVAAAFLDALLAPMAQKHPQHCRRATGEEFPAISDPGLYSTPRQPRRREIEGCSRRSRRGDGFLTGRLFDW